MKYSPSLLPPTLDAKGLSKLLYKSPSSLLRDINRRPLSLPPFKKIGRKTVWVTANVFRWLGYDGPFITIESNSLPPIKSLGESIAEANGNSKKKNEK